ncbi:MAG: hypothetical protein JSW66_08845 [Phycisphaerales bacterium]|nr:MAG: hypothetical protein JSW66_08845 [Phycisphaerales bacterium]
MADYESNLIKPVKSLQTITGLTPARQRDERNRRQQLHQEQDEQAKNEENVPEKQIEDENDDKHRDGARIDYCA